MLPQVQSRSQGHIASLPLFLVNSDSAVTEHEGLLTGGVLEPAGATAGCACCRCEQPPPNPPPKEESISIFGGSKLCTCAEADHEQRRQGLWCLPRLLVTAGAVPCDPVVAGGELGNFCTLQRGLCYIKHHKAQRCSRAQQ